MSGFRTLWRSSGKVRVGLTIILTLSVLAILNGPITNVKVGGANTLCTLTNLSNPRIGKTALSSPVEATLGTIQSGHWKSVELRFQLSIGNPGAPARLRVRGSFQGGFFGDTFGRSLP